MSRRGPPNAVPECYRHPLCDVHHDFCGPDGYDAAPAAVSAFMCPVKGAAGTPHGADPCLGGH